MCFLYSRKHVAFPLQTAVMQRSRQKPNFIVRYQTTVRDENSHTSVFLRIKRIHKRLVNSSDHIHVLQQVTSQNGFEFS
jgi:hypothetical protein